MASLTLLVASDFHYSRGVSAAGDDGAAARSLGPEWVRRVVQDALADASPDAFVLLGDLLDDGAAPAAEHDLRTIAEAAREGGMPVIVVPGNHDGDAARCLRVFGDRPGAHYINGYNLFTIVDAYDDEGRCGRSAEALEAVSRAAGAGPVIVLQHPPVFPDVDCSEYPYLPSNVEEVRRCYSRAGVVLSISGHYHDGTPLAELDGVRYLACGAAVRPPHRYYLITVDGGSVGMEERALRMPTGSGIHDIHTHSHFGYCAQDVHPEKSLRRADLLGLRGVTCLEHAGQLYLPEEEYWRWAHVEDPSAITRRRGTPANRMAAFRSAMARVRSERLHVGLEVECDREGGLNLLEEDREGWDLLLGAVHVLPSNLPSRTPRECVASFLKVVERLLAGGVHALAHPLRLFPAGDRRLRDELYAPLARLLRDHGAAAEINFHNNRPDPEFYRICLDECVRLVLGSDAHRLDEVGALQPHLRLLRRIGVAVPERVA